MARLQLGRVPSRPNDAARLADLAGTVNPGWVSNKWYLPKGASAVSGNTSSTATGVIRLMPVYLKSALTVNAFAARVSTALAGGTFQIMVYAHNPATGLPTGAPIYTTASISAATAGTISSATGLALALNPGWQWLGIATSGTVGFGVMDSVMADYTQEFGTTTAALALSASGSVVTSLSVANTYNTPLTMPTAQTSFTEVTSPIMPAIAFQSATTG